VKLVCPVQATSHSSEGLNDMVYNRCVGTRYCSTTAPTRCAASISFLFSDYETPASAAPQSRRDRAQPRRQWRNAPTACSASNAAKIDAEKEGRKLRDGEIQTGLPGHLSHRTIVFGHVNARIAAFENEGEKLTTGWLADLNTRPRTTYLAELRNPNPEIGE